MANHRTMFSFLASTVAFFVAAYFIRRYLEGMDIPKTMLRGFVVFVLAIAVAYGVGFVVDTIEGWVHPEARAF
jgi:VIT1/CCC1 family predicted Fe2+/Mn2+ transporter